MQRLSRWLLVGAFALAQLHARVAAEPAPVGSTAVEPSAPRVHTRAQQSDAQQPHAQQPYAKLSPFEAVRWREASPEVKVDGRWYELVSIDDLATARIVAYCDATYRAKAHKRFEEDLVEVLHGLGHAVDRHVALELRDLDGGAASKLARVEMTEANREAIRAAARAAASTRVASSGSAFANAAVEAASAAPVVRRVVREHAPEPAAAYSFLARFLELDDATEFVGATESMRPPGSMGAPVLTREQAAADLDQLEWRFADRYSYARLRGVDTAAAFDAIRAALPERVGVAAFAIQLMKLFALYGDGHSGLVQAATLLPGGCAPFLVEEVGGQPIAFLPDRSGFVDPDHPVLLSIAGVPVQRWIDAAARIEAQGSPQLARRRAVHGLRQLGYLALELGVALGETFDVELASLDSSSRVARTQRLAERRPTYGRRIASPTRRIDGDVGYLRIAEMDDAPKVLSGIDAAMSAFRGTRGLIVDVRENGGGSRAALRTLFPYFARAGEEPAVVNVAAYKLGADEARGVRDGYLADRWLYPADASVWRAHERAAIAAATSAFRPEWTPPAAEFSAWHYFVLQPGDNPRAYRYERPVVVLMDEGCFSATDVFLSALKGRPGITLIGTPSAGGSGRAASEVLANSRLEFRLSSMASFRADGTLYEGRGVEPDVRIEPAAIDLLGRGDRVLDFALARVRATPAR